MKVIETIIAVLICSFVLSLGVSWLLSIVFSMPFSTLIIMTSVLISLICLIGGAFSLIVEKLLQQLQRKKDIEYYPTALISYGILGILLNYFFYLSIFQNEWGEAFIYLFFGVFVSCFYFHIMIFSRWMLKSLFYKKVK
ncbi:hypothetical protein [Halalkalibacter sp. APA_J-10(15)]|uniref:hypothetical protein n=1 Tax=Halalkalibacter sp. APA_J-10(15) TaxID=2933805 RepID=UPI001FF637D2|nr:hypothetical protein [Halalkalibacter sp. APA_J-10(15)]MCK0470565.1 hypothetical protein [Halalkalibacter sp. APA_J-10(15)]